MPQALHTQILPCPPFLCLPHCLQHTTHFSSMAVPTLSSTAPLCCPSPFHSMTMNVHLPVKLELWTQEWPSPRSSSCRSIQLLGTYDEVTPSPSPLTSLLIWHRYVPGTKWIVKVGCDTGQLCRAEGPYAYLIEPQVGPPTHTM